MAIKVESAAFEHGARIPARFTCDGDDTSPPIRWSGLPAGTQSLVLISDDPDAPVGTWDHWVIFNIPGNSNGLDEGVPRVGELSDGSRQGRNSWRRLGYGGPCPPSGTHRYYFRLFALDSALKLEAGSDKKQVQQAMQGHILAEGELLGLYSRK